jgi:hypothetical protein
MFGVGRKVREKELDRALGTAERKIQRDSLHAEDVQQLNEQLIHQDGQAGRAAPVAVGFHAVRDSQKGAAQIRRCFPDGLLVVPQG